MVNPSIQAKATTTLIEPSKPMSPEGGLSQYGMLPLEFFTLSQSGTADELFEYLYITNPRLSSGAYQYLLDLYDYRSSDDYDGYETTTYTQVENNGGGSVTGMRKMFEYHSVETRAERGSNFSKLISEILAGNRVIASVDANELSRVPLINEVQSESDLVSLLSNSDALESGANHAVWINRNRFLITQMDHKLS